MRRTSYVLALGLTACSDTYDPNPGPKYGELGVGVFLYECPSSGDPFCSDGTGTAGKFPQAFALGGRINLEYDWRDDDEHIGDPPPQLQSASPSLLTREGDGFTAAATGYAAVLAVTGNNEVVDLVHLHIREIDELQVVPADQHAAAPLQQLTLDRGDERELQAIAVDSDSVLLGGVLGHTWTSADPTIVAVVAGGDSGRVRVEALQSGTTTLTLVHDELSVQLTVTVEGEDDETSSTGDSESGDSSDSSGGSSDSSGDAGGDTSGSSGGVL